MWLIRKKLPIINSIVTVLVATILIFLYSSDLGKEEDATRFSLEKSRKPIELSESIKESDTPKDTSKSEAKVAWHQERKKSRYSPKMAHYHSLSRLTPIDTLERKTANGEREIWQLVEAEVGKPIITYALYSEDSIDQNPGIIGALIANQLVVTLQKDANENVLVQKYDIKIADHIKSQNLFLFSFNTSNIESYFDLKKRLTQEKIVKQIDANLIVYAAATPYDEFSSGMWHLDAIGIKETWDTKRECTSGMIAVLDSGVYADHPDLKGNILTDISRNFVPSFDPNDFRDRFGHGTHIAGTIAARTDNSIGISGLCWRTQIVVFKVLDDSGAGTLWTLNQALSYLISNRETYSDVKLLNLSLGWQNMPQDQVKSFKDLVGELAKLGNILVMAAGNLGFDIDVIPYYPATFDFNNGISVMAYNSESELATFSNYTKNLKKAVSAPGTGIISTMCTPDCDFSSYKGNPLYSSLRGTSMATPMVTAALALYWTMRPSLSNYRIVFDLLQTGILKTDPTGVKVHKMMDLNGLFEFKAKESITSKPRIDIVGNPSPSLGDTITLNIAANSEDLAKLEVYLNYEKVLESTKSSETLPLVAHKQGPMVAFAMVKSMGDNISISEPFTYIVKRPAPVIAIDSIPDELTPYSTLNFNATINHYEGHGFDTMEVRVQEKKVTSCTTIACKFEVANFPLGSHELKVVALDKTGKIIASYAKTLKVTNQAPQIELDEAISTIYHDESLKVAYVAFDPDNDIERIELWIGGELIKTQKEAKGYFTLSPQKIGVYNYFLRVYDRYGATSQSPLKELEVLRNFKVPYEFADENPPVLKLPDGEIIGSPLAEKLGVTQGAAVDVYQVCEIAIEGVIQKNLTLQVDSTIICIKYCEIIAPSFLDGAKKIGCQIDDNEIIEIADKSIEE